MDLKLKKYSSLSATLIGAAISNAQVTHVEFDPDIVVDDATLLMDLNSDSQNDFVFSQFDATGTSMYPFVNRQANIAGYFGTNAFIISYLPWHTSGYYPVAKPLATSSVIDTSGHTWRSGAGKLGSMYNGPYNSFSYCLVHNISYVGVQFLISGNMHYGWIRLKVENDPDYNLIIYDAAYEQSPNTPIHIDGILGLGSSASQTINLYTSGKQLNFDLTDMAGIKSISIMNTMGSLVYTASITEGVGVMDLSHLSAGAYLFHVIGEKETVCEKFYLAE